MYCVSVLAAGAIPLPAQLDVGRLSCELAAGHHGSHMAFATAAHDGDQWWWLRWSGQPAAVVGELVQIDPCDAVFLHGPYPDDCILPQGHPGPHSFDVLTASQVSGGRHPVRGRSGRSARRVSCRDGR
jgi:hypothetical protein